LTKAIGIQFLKSLSNLLFLCRLDFWNLPVNPVWRVPGFMKEGKADNEHSNPVLLPLAPEFTNICISHLQLLHFQKFWLEVVAIGRKNAGWESNRRKSFRREYFAKTLFFYTCCTQKHTACLKIHLTKEIDKYSYLPRIFCYSFSQNQGQKVTHII
jgi:hypothetical protein